MHEVSIVLSLLEIVEEECRAAGYPAVAAVKVRVGKAGGILPEALGFAFQALRGNTPAHEARLIIDWVPLGGFCLDCRRQFQTEEKILFACPLCGSPSFQVSQGYELQVVELEVNERGPGGNPGGSLLLANRAPGGREHRPEPSPRWIS
jgi:hydrogenase nickel incorporation protein HypA/HybF